MRKFAPTRKPIELETLSKCEQTHAFTANRTLCVFEYIFDVGTGSVSATTILGIHSAALAGFLHKFMITLQGINCKEETNL